MPLPTRLAPRMLLALALLTPSLPLGCAPASTAGQGDGVANRKVKEEVGRKVLEPVPVTPGKSRNRGGGTGAVDSSL